MNERERDLRRKRRETWDELKGMLTSAQDEQRGLTTDEICRWGEHQETLARIDLYLRNGGVMSEWGNRTCCGECTTGNCWKYDGAPDTPPVHVERTALDEIYFELHPGYPHSAPLCWAFWEGEWMRTGAVYALDRMRTYPPPPEPAPLVETVEDEVNRVLSEDRTHAARFCASVLLALVGLMFFTMILIEMMGAQW